MIDSGRLAARRRTRQVTTMSRFIAFVWFLIAILATPMCTRQQPATPPPPVNPLLVDWTTPLGVPPFGEIKPEHYLPAFKEAVAAQRREIEAIAADPAPPTFDNTIARLDAAGDVLAKVNHVFQNLAEAETNDQIQAVSREVAPMLAAAQDDILMNAALFARIRTLWENRSSLNLTPPQAKLLKDVYRSFVRGGANLDAADKNRLRAINAELALAGVKFGDNLLHDTNSYELVIERKEDLAGLPDSVVTMAAEAAQKAGRAGRWLFTLHAPSIWPFLQYADSRELRRTLLEAYISRGSHGDAYDNQALVASMVSLRAEKAALVGYQTFADYQLDEYMAKTPARVYDLLKKVWTPARAMALKEKAALEKMMKQAGDALPLQPWDWRYYAEKVRKARFDVDEETLRPYFRLEHVRDGAFYVASRLFGLRFEPRPDLPVYHPEVQAFEVKDADSSHLGVLYLDFHPRPGKKGGGWTDLFREHAIKAGRDVRPIAVIVCNFSRPAGDRPSLLSVEEVETLFHEFGHALHVLLDRTPYRRLASFNVPADFVELQSSIMENWALDPDVLAVYARHFQTGEVIPTALVDKLKKARQFNQGFATVEYLAASFLDMDWHIVKAPVSSVEAFERESLARIGLPREIPVRYRSPYFSHVFGPGGGYAAGYYSYIWSEVLDADAFELFKEKGLFDQATAKAFRTHILEAGASEEAMTLYKRFRGAEPSVEPLLRRRGLM